MVQGKINFFSLRKVSNGYRHVTLKDPKRKSLRRRRRPVTTHETLCRYVIATDTTASDYLDTLSGITTGTNSRYPCNRSINVDEGLSVCCCCCCCCCFDLIASQISRLPYDFSFIDLLFCFTNKNVRRLRLILFMGSDW